MSHKPGIGIDIHAAFYQLAVVGPDGVVAEERISTGVEGVKKIVDRIRSMSPAPVVAMEACTGTYHLYHSLQNTGATILVVDPRKMRERFPKRGKKTDKVDALNLANLATFHNVKGNWIPPESTRKTRELTRERCRITEQCTTEMNRIHSKLKEYGIRWPGASKKLWTEDGRRWLSNQMQKAPGWLKMTVVGTLERLDLLWKQKRDLESAICEEALQLEEARLLMTVPGVSAVGSAVIRNERGDWRRFDNSKQLVSYAGLNPSVSQSGNSCYHGPISKHGRSNLRWICVELALSAYQHCPVLKAFHDRIKKKTRCSGKAKVATGRKLLALCWHILRTGRPYNHERQDLTKRKEARIRQVAHRTRSGSGVNSVNTG